MTRSSEPFERILREHHARAVRLDHALHDDADARRLVHAERAPVGAGRFGVRGLPHLEDRVDHVVLVAHVEDRHVLAGEARAFRVLADGRGAHGAGAGQRR